MTLKAKLEIRIISISEQIEDTQKDIAKTQERMTNTLAGMSERTPNHSEADHLVMYANDFKKAIEKRDNLFAERGMLEYMLNTCED